MTRLPQHDDGDNGANYEQVRSSSVRGAGTNTISVAVQFAIRGCSTIVLARLLLPEDFGLVAIAGIALNFFARIVDLGLTTASMQRYRVSDNEFSTLFWTNVAVAFVLTSVMVTVAPLMAIVFDDERIKHIVMALSAILLITGVGAQHESVLRRSLRFNALATVSPISQAVGTGVGIVAAIFEYGYWSIVIMSVVSRLLATAGYWIATRWKPGKPSISPSVLPFLRYGSRVSGSQALIYVTHNLDSILIGVLSGAADLGLYRRGFNLLQLPVEHYKAQLERLVPSSLSRLQHNERDFARLYRHGITGMAFVGCAAIGAVFAIAPALVQFLLGDAWLGTVPYLRWLAPAALVALLEVAIVWLMVPLAEGNKLLVVRAIRVALVALGMVVGNKYGSIGIAAGYGLGSVISLVFELGYSSVNYPKLIASALNGIWRSAFAACLAAIVVIITSGEPSNYSLLIDAGVYVGLYLGIHVIVPGGRGILRMVRLALFMILPSRNLQQSSGSSNHER